MKPILMLSLRQLISRWRLLLIMFLAVLPIALSALMAAIAGDDSDYVEEFTNVIIDAFVIAILMPIVTMVLATTAFSHELDDRTLSYLILKPIPRSMIVLPKILATIIVGGLLVVASCVIATLIGPDVSGQALFAVGIAVFVGVVAYTTIFTWAGLISSHALGFALIYVFLWEALVTSLLSGVRYLSVRGYVLSIMNGIDGESYSTLDERVIEFPAAIVGVTAVTALFFWLTVRRLRRMDVP